MTLFELVDALGGELVCNEARMRRDGKSLSHIARVLGVGKSSVARALERADTIRRA